MNDLRIRGGGTILGASQSGHIAAVGYEMFLRLMENAVAELKGETVAERLDPEINVNVSTLLAESYIPDLDQRLIAYRRLAKMSELKEIVEFKSELEDRYGALPEEAGNLLLKIALKVLAKKIGITRLDLTGPQLILQFSDHAQINRAGLVEMVMSEPRRFELTPAGMLKVNLFRRGVGGQLAQTKNILKEVAQHVSK
jgi:transcription-repair coupling factor (superfamily II helicase)